MTDVNLSSTDDAEKPAGHDVDDPGQDPALDDVTSNHEAALEATSFGELAELGHVATELDPDAKPVLSVENLRMYFPVKAPGLIRRTVGYVQAVDGISFQVPEAGSLGLVGESGCGKSTTGRLITRLYKPTGGSMMFEGHDVAKLSSRQMKPLRRHVQMIFQDPYTSLNPRHTVGAIVGAPLSVHDIVPRNKILPRVQELLEVVGPQPRALQPLPQRVLRRSAPAHRHRPRTDAEPQAAGGRRAGLRVGRVDPGAGHQPSAGPAEGVRHRVPVHRPRPRRGEALLPRDRGDVPRQDRGDR